jgi:hypothetical protein
VPNVEPLHDLFGRSSTSCPTSTPSSRRESQGRSYDEMWWAFAVLLHRGVMGDERTSDQAWVLRAVDRWHDRKASLGRPKRNARCIQVEECTLAAGEYNYLHPAGYFAENVCHRLQSPIVRVNERII